MLKFNSFITEAAFNKTSLEKAAKLIHTILAKRLHAQLFRYDGANGFIDLKIGGKDAKGLLFFMKNKKAFCLNFVNGSIHSLSIWKSYRTDKKADYTASLQGLNVISVIDEIAEIIMNPKVGDVPLYFVPEEVEHEEAILTEARRVKDPHEFHKMAKELFPNAHEEQYDYHMLDAVGKHNDVQIPGYVKSQKTGKKTFSITPPDAASKAANLPPEKIYHITITPQDPITKKFLSSKDDAKAASVMADIKKSLDGNKKPDAAELKDPDSLFGKLVKLTKLILNGTGNSLFVYGGAGIGKTFTITDTIKSAGLQKNTDWYHIKGKVTATSLYQTLYLHREGKLIVFDDADSAFGSEDSANILKGALDSYEERFISWNSARTVNLGKMNNEDRAVFYADLDAQILEDPSSSKIKYPSEFQYEGRIIFISNLSAKDIDTAILSRSFKIDMSLTDAQVFHRIESLIDHIGDPSIPKEKKIEVLNYLKEKNALGDLSNPNIRMFTVALKIANSGLPDWFELLEHT